MVAQVIDKHAVALVSAVSLSPGIFLFIVLVAIVVTRGF